MISLPARFIVLALLLAASAHAQASYPRMAPLDQYQMPRQSEIDMARSAAPPSISAAAEVLVLGKTGYEVAAKGANGFVCLVQRSFAAGIESPEFWNPRIRAPICLNPESVRSFLPHLTKKAEWVLAGLSLDQIAGRIKNALNSGEFPAFKPGAMCYMMSKQAYLSDNDPHWHPHLMWFVAATDPATWGANLPGSPVFEATDAPERYSIFLVPMERWSDGTLAPAM
ncbi:MAG TPA: hypothetical protein VG897_02685 [Terriglobales bacterium]|nr:hypothetical protein [Terriglobales bacterium]